MAAPRISVRIWHPDIDDPTNEEFITSDVLIEGGITFKWGAHDAEQSNRAPASAVLRLRNHHGRYTPTNPESDLFGIIGRGTQFRIRVLGGPPESTGQWETRFIGWANSWLPKWSESEQDHIVEVELFGPRQRLGANREPLETTLERGVPRLLPGVIGYWPMTGGKYTRDFPDVVGEAGPAEAKPWDPNGGVYRGEYEAAATGPIPVLKGTSWVQCSDLPRYPTTGHLWLLAYTRFPDDMPDATTFGVPIMALNTSTQATSQWVLYVTSEGRLRIRAYSSEGDEIVGPAWTSGYDVRGREGFVFIRLENQGGGQLYWRYGFFPADQPAPPDYDYDVNDGTVNGAYAGTATGWYLWHEDIPDAAWGHVVLGNANALWDAETNGKLARLVSAYSGERAADRIQRLCDEEGLWLHITDSGLSARMGPQRTKGLLELLDECANAEDAIMYDSYGVAPNNDYNHVMWRSLGTLWNQAPKVTLDYEAGHISPPLDVIIDDRGAVNDMTIQQDGGTARKYVDMDGPAGVNTIGRYSASKTLNLYELAQLEPRAAWEVRKGTVIEPRIGAVTVNVAINDELRYPCEQIYPGDFIEVVNLPRRVTPDPIKLMVVGVQEHITESMRLFTFITVPGSVYDMGHTWGNSATDMFARADLTDSTVATDGFVTGTDTALVVDVPTVPWTTDPADLPFDVRVAGAVLTVTDVSPVVDGQQGFVVSATVKNGVVKELPVGARVQIEPGAYAASV